MDEFAAQFQAFIGKDIHALPEHAREAMCAQGVTRCRAAVPCFQKATDASAYVCECLMRARKWVAFWKLVRADQEDALPTLIATQNSARWTPYHRPIFTWICRPCGARSDSYSRGRYEPVFDDTRAMWLKASCFAKPIDVIRRHVISSFQEHYVCSERCAQAIKLESDKWEPGRLDAIWAKLDTSASEHEIGHLGIAYGIERDPTRSRVDGIKDVRERLREFQRQLRELRRRDELLPREAWRAGAEASERAANRRAALNSLAGGALDLVARNSGIERWPDEDDDGLRSRIITWGRNKGRSEKTRI